MFIGYKLERMHFKELAHCPRNLTKFEWDVLHKEHSYSFFVHYQPLDIIVLKQVNKDIIRQLLLLRSRQTLQQFLHRINTLKSERSVMFEE